jgi:hypothetical protein
MHINESHHEDGHLNEIEDRIEAHHCGNQTHHLVGVGLRGLVLQQEKGDAMHRERSDIGMNAGSKVTANPEKSQPKLPTCEE